MVGTGARDYSCRSKRMQSRGLPDSPPQGASATRPFLVGWPDYDAFCKGPMGVYRDVAGNVVQSKGLSFPGNRDKLICESCEVDPFDASDPANAAWRAWKAENADGNQAGGGGRGAGGGGAS